MEGIQAPFHYQLSDFTGSLPQIKDLGIPIKSLLLTWLTILSRFCFRHVKFIPGNEMELKKLQVKGK